MTRRIYTVVAAAALALAGSSGCQTKSQAPPPFSGPSEMAISISMSATPDTIAQDGVSQAQLVLQARDASNQPIANLPLRLDTSSGGVVADFGQLSARQVVTGGDGRATAVFTAPNTAQTNADVLSSVSILATPISGNASGSAARSITIRLTTTGGVIPPSQLPRAVVNFSPLAPRANADVVFDGAQSTVTVGSIVGYAWDFGDGTTANGSPVAHRFSTAGTFTVTLKVTDDRGFTGSATATVDVTDSTAPTAAFTFSPSNPLVNQRVGFSGSASTAAPGRTIVTYAWDLGNGDTPNGANVSTTYLTAQDYQVSLTVSDDLGKRATVTKTVTVDNSPAPTASFTSSPTSPVILDTVVFDASSTTTAPGQSVTSLAWNFGDGTAVVTCPGGAGCSGSRIISHVYTLAGTYVVNLLVTDSAGRTSSKSSTVGVGTGNPEPVIVASPTTGAAATLFQFAATGTKLYSGATITAYSWNFGDPTTGLNNTSVAATATHTFSAPGTYTVRLTVTDSQGRVGSVTITVVVT